MKEFAKSKGWWKPDQEFDFAKVIIIFLSSFIIMVCFRACILTDKISTACYLFVFLLKT